MRHLVIITTMAAGLAACEFIPLTPQNRIADAKARISIHSADPTTIRWSGVKEYRGAVCGTFNAQEEGYPIRTELVWTGPRQFVTIKGAPTVVDGYSDCETDVAAAARCLNDGDAEKVREAVASCKAYQAEQRRQSQEQIDEIFKSSGLVQSGSLERDQITLDERFKQSDRGPQNYMDYDQLSHKLGADRLWDRTYNAHMRSLPAGATTAQKVAAAAEAVKSANAAAEAYLAEKGYR